MIPQRLKYFHFFCALLRTVSISTLRGLTLFCNGWFFIKKDCGNNAKEIKAIVNRNIDGTFYILKHVAVWDFMIFQSAEWMSMVTLLLPGKWDVVWWSCFYCKNKIKTSQQQATISKHIIILLLVTTTSTITLLISVQPQGVQHQMPTLYIPN